MGPFYLEHFALKKLIHCTLILVVILLHSSCSGLSFWPLWGRGDNVFFASHQEILPKDYLLHIEKLGDFFLQTDGVKTVALSQDSSKYLKKIYDRIVANNELLLKHDFNPKFLIIDDITPFVFSLPHAKFYISTGVINRYLKNEGVLVAALTYEIIKTQNSLYPKKRIVPIGHLSVERMISLTRIPLDVRLEIDRWSFFALERAGYDPYAFMLWIQLQNKNALDFTLHYGDARGISREEFLLKNILVRERNDDAFEDGDQFQSSDGFYRFQQELKRKSDR